MLKSIVRNGVHSILAPMERKLLMQPADKVVPPCFILGAPRSGTTLIYELLVTCYEFSYFTNLANSFYKTPLAVSKLGDHYKRNWHGSRESSFGSVKGLGAPNEAGNLWGRWIPEFDHLDEHDAINRKSLLNESAMVIQAMRRLHHAPFINKNVMHSVHVRLLNAAYPDCMFIDLRREVKANVRSIVRARMKKGGPTLDGDGWWSVRPQNIEPFCDMTQEEQACAQVIKLRRDVDESFAKIGGNRRIIINYEDICLEPESTLKLIAQFLEPACGKLISRYPFPASISQSPSILFSDEIEKRINLMLNLLDAS